jgi:N6-L-threonylcarbamoyladenine synthase
MIVLGIESSCDETAAAVVDDRRRVLAESLFSQLDEHRPYGGVVPEVAARAHLEHLGPLIAATMQKAGLGFAALDGIAATAGPGLIGGVIVGVTMAKAIAAVHRKPFFAVNHLEGHALSARLSDDVAFPYLLLLVSGGHCQLLVVEDAGRYHRLGATIDDAAGEAFDKAAKLLGLGYPGGPAIQRAAEGAATPVLDLPRPMLGRPDCNFSFSGLKTALRQRVEDLRVEELRTGEMGGAGTLPPETVANLAAGFEIAVTESVADRVKRAIGMARERAPDLTALVVAGGVAANKRLRARLAETAAKGNLPLIAPPIQLCTDNAAMIAWAGLEHLKRGEISALDFAPRPRWPLDDEAPALRGAGVKA